jgi:hypothetical protein
MKIVVYQAIFGGRDDYWPPLYLPKDVHYHFIMGQGGTMEAKRFKILPHRYFENYDISVWMDGNFQLTGDISKVIDKFMGKSSFAVLRHPAENLGIVPTVYREAEVAILQKTEQAARIKEQIKRYRKEGLPLDTEVTMNGIIIRKHNEPKVRAACEAWWREIKDSSSRDQISFPYICWKFGLKYAKMDNVEFASNWFQYRPHKGARK